MSKMKDSDLVEQCIIYAVNWECSVLDAHGWDQTDSSLQESFDFIKQAKRYYKKRYGRELVSIFDERMRGMD